jgi:hypothetical protein
MTRYHAGEPVQVFDPQLQHDVPGVVVTATSSCVLVSLNDRMCPVVVDPADHFRIHPIEAATHA